ncbi:nuclease-related domain-containing protein [Microbacterium sp. PRF11]|uniref:nuclease-related domain-containing protein n=1 Tax=Microbacterium sp. PRF11 TaxID=2962593 RepID=UPI002880BECF|nr:nuclease-related domain-containing protein [Microbacterium sp. PRF11]MDT0117793.1 nuclease-related domain-containing protein [Microbacterium sp. PRF11]
MTEALAWTVCAVAAAISLALPLWMRRRYRSTADATRRDHAAAMTALEAEHVQAREELRASLSAAIVTEASAREAERQRAEAILDYARRALTWDQVAHADIVAALEAERIDAVVATNVVRTVAAEGRAFVAQIDHVLLTDRDAVVIEGKHWTGLTFDGVRPHEAHAGLGALFDEDDLSGEFALNLTRRPGGTLAVRLTSTATFAAGTTNRPPRAQARAHAAHLKDALVAAGHDVAWVTPAVYYSHRDGVLVADTPATSTSPGRVAGRTQTPVVGDPRTLQRWLGRTLRPGRSSTPAWDLEGIADQLSAWGANLEGTGSYRDRWRSML